MQGSYNCDVLSISWDIYMTVWAHGMKVFLLKEGPVFSAQPRSRRLPVSVVLLLCLSQKATCLVCCATVIIIQSIYGGDVCCFWHVATRVARLSH